MGNIKFELNRDGVRELMRSSEMQAICDDYAAKALQSLGDGYDMSSHKGRNRVNTRVTAVTHAARKNNSETNALLKALKG